MKINKNKKKYRLNKLKLKNKDYNTLYKIILYIL